MNIHGYDVSPYRAGWCVTKSETRVHQKGKNAGQEYTHNKHSYYPRIDQCLRHIADDKAKDCETVEELLEMWGAF